MAVFCGMALLIVSLILGGCGTTPRAADPPRRAAALEAESDGARRYERGDYTVAARRFDEAVRLYTSIDDSSGAQRNRRHLARSELALGRADAALLLLNAAERNVGGLDLETLLLKAQAQLALDRHDAARHSLAAAAEECAGACTELASLHLLQARAALAEQRPADALTHAENALKLLADKDEAIETANAWRLIAAAQLAAGAAANALPAAQAALDIDRRLALPEKIARDWLLIGDIQRKLETRALHARAPHGGESSSGAANSASCLDGMPSPCGTRASGAAESYQRALDVAHAAGLADIAGIAAKALAEARAPLESGQKQPIRH